MNSAEDLFDLYESYLGIYDGLNEAKVDKIIASRSNKSPLETAGDIEDVRNVRAFGTASNRDRDTGMRRTYHEWDRLATEKELPTGNQPTVLNPKYDSRVGVRQQLMAARKRQEVRNFAKELKQREAANEYIKRENSNFAARNAENQISKFQRSDVEYVLDYLIDEGYTDSYDSAAFILEAMSDEEIAKIIRDAPGQIRALRGGPGAAEILGRVKRAQEARLKNLEKRNQPPTNTIKSLKGFQRPKDRFQRSDVEYVLDYLIDEGYTDSYDSATYILEAMSDEWLDEILEARVLRAMTPAKLAKFKKQIAQADKWERETGSRLSPSDQAALRRLTARLAAQDAENKPTKQTTLGTERSTTARRRPRTNLGSVQIK